MKPAHIQHEFGENNKDFLNQDDVGGLRVSKRPSDKSNRFDHDFDDNDSQYQGMLLSDRTGQS